jgi:hypothetical protein
MENKQTILKSKVGLPKFWIGLFFPAASLMLCLLVWVDSEYKITEQFELYYNKTYGWRQQFIDATPLHPYVPFAVFFIIAGWAYWLYCVHRVHEVMAQVTDGDHPVSPNRAAWFHLIPIYNLYWVFKWTGEIAKSVHKRSYQVMPEKMFGVFLFLILLIQYSMSLDVMYLIPPARDAFRQAIAPSLGRSTTPMALLILCAVVCRATALAAAVMVGIKVSKQICGMIENPIS